MYDLRGPLTATQLVNGKTGNPALVSRFQSQCLSTVPHYVAFPKSNTGLGRWLGLLEHENGQFFQTPYMSLKKQLYNFASSFQISDEHRENRLKFKDSIVQSHSHCHFWLHSLWIFFYSDSSHWTIRNDNQLFLITQVPPPPLLLQQLDCQSTNV